MDVRRGGLVWVLVLLLAACGGDKKGSGDGAHGAVGGDHGGAATPSSSEAAGSKKGKAYRPHPLTTLTKARLDDYLGVLKAAAADPKKDASEIAMARGWKIGDWVYLDAAVKQVAAAGGYDAFLDRIRKQSADTMSKIEAYDTQATNGPEAYRKTAKTAASTLRNAVEGWQRTLGQADAMRAGGELIDSRMAEVKAATGK